MTNWIIDTMVSMTLLMALVLIIRKPVSRYFGAHIAYFLWALPFARLFMPTLTLKAPAPVESADAAAATPLLSDIASTASGKITAAGAAVNALASIDWAMIALVLWLGGGAMLFISKLAAYFQFREDIVSDGQLVGRHGRIKILETAAVGGPLAFGLFEKYIAVPTHFYRDYAPRERQLALEHEIAHHESGDLWANFIGLLVLSLHWFNPVAWYAWAMFRQDQETACDARVLQKGGRDLAAVYGRTIAKSVSGHRLGLGLGLASPLNQKNKIKDRLKMLGQTEKSTLRKRMGALMIGASTVVALPLTATITYAVETGPQPHEGGEENALAMTAEKPELKKIAAAENAQKAAAPRQGRDLAQAAVPVAPLSPEPVPEPAVAAAAPASPAPPAAPVRGSVSIAMQHGENERAKIRVNGAGHIQQISYNGRTVIVKAGGLKTGETLDEEEIRSRFAAAEQAHREAKERLKESLIARQEIRIALAEAQREVQRETRRAQREAQRQAQEAQREAREAHREAMAAAREAQQQAREAKSVAARIWEVSQITFKPFSSVISSSQQAEQTDAMNIPYADQPEADQKAVLITALKSLEHERAKAACANERDGSGGGVRQRIMVETFDRGIENLKARLSLT